MHLALAASMYFSVANGKRGIGVFPYSPCFTLNVERNTIVINSGSKTGYITGAIPRFRLLLKKGLKYFSIEGSLSLFELLKTLSAGIKFQIKS